MVGISTVSRKEHVAAQTREVVATKEVLPQVTGRTLFFGLESNHVCYYIVDLKVVEVAYDYQPQVSRYVTDDLQLLNSYDTWHGKSSIDMYSNVMLIHVGTLLGTKNVAKCGRSL